MSARTKTPEAAALAAAEAESISAAVERVDVPLQKALAVAVMLVSMDSEPSEALRNNAISIIEDMIDQARAALRQLAKGGAA